jgi:NAD(P)-dependent dehydrogenase (short-subunit alcohol dehydrogenase family)
MDLKLNGKTALVTGSSAGIGFEIAKALSAEGADVFLTGRVQAKLGPAAADIAEATGRTPRAVLADAATAEGAEALIAAVRPSTYWSTISASMSPSPSPR